MSKLSSDIHISIDKIFKLHMKNIIILICVVYYNNI